MRAALVVVIAVGLVSQISAECANACSGHGVCRNSDQCDCFPNYMAADCSQRVCPYGLAWVDNPRGDLDHDGLRTSSSVVVNTFTNGDSAASSGTVSVTDWEGFNPNAQTDEGHYYSECSNKGLCDRSTGLCVCFDGYTGSSCQRTSCPNDCSGNGVCRTVAEVAAGALNNSVAAGAGEFISYLKGLNVRQTDNRAGSVFWEGITQSTLYRLWDADMAQTCVCDPGFSGPDCSQRECPRGDDPLTHRYGDCPIQANPGAWTSTAPCVDEVQTLEISTTGAAATEWFHILYKDWTGKIWKTDDFVVSNVAATTACSGTSSKIPVASTASTLQQAITTALKGIPNSVIPDVTVVVDDSTVGTPAAMQINTAVTSTGFKVTVTFTKNPGNLQALTLVHSPQMQKELPPCNVNGGFSVATVYKEADGNKEASTCSNRGVCDYTSGLCKCFKGYYGGDCSKQNALSQ